MPAAASLTITTGGTEASNITAPSTATIPTGETAANFSITLAAGAAANNNGTVSISNAVFLPAQQTTANVAGIAYTLNVDDTVGTFTLIVGAQPDGTINICDRTPEVVTAILISLSLTGTDCAAVPTTQPNLISQLDFEDNTLTFLQVGDFANLPNLNNLDLGVNRLASLPVNVFDSLSNLTRLNLGTNRLESLPAGLFDGLSTNLETLILDNNNLTSLDENPFDGLNRLRLLDLRSNSNLTLPAGLFDDVLDTLTTLNLDDAFKATVSIDLRAAVIMPGSSHDLTLQLTTSLPADVRLRVTLGGTAASFLRTRGAATIPAGMTTATFNISLNGAATVGSTGTVVLNNPGIAYTDSFNQLRTNSQAGVLNSLVNTLNTANNTFAFSVSNQPDTLVNICGRTDEVRAAILAAPRVTETNCMEVPQAQLNTITRLSFNDFVADNNISALQGGDFANLPNLATLILTTNDLVRLPENVFDGLSNLTDLSLGVNSLNSLPANVFNGLSRLTRLNLGTNRLESLPARLFDGLSNLEMLILDSNNLASLDENLFDDLSNLEMLILDNNNLASLDENLFDDLSNLEMLVLNNNNLTSLDENLFDGLSNLEMLVLNNNNLTSLDENLFDGLDSLRSLFLNSNSLTPPLPAGLFNDVLDTLTELNLGGQANSVDLISTVSIEPVTPVIALNASQTFTVQLTPPSPVGVLLTITAGGTQQAGNVTLLAPANVTIPAGASFATFDITLTGGTLGNTGTVVIEDVGSALIYTRDGMEQENTVPEVVEHLLDVSGGPSSTPISTFTVLAQQPDGTVNICNRTPQVETAILNRLSLTEADCAAVPQVSLDGILILNIRNDTNINNLRIGDFANLPGLQNMDLVNINLGPSLPAGLFDDLGALGTLDLRDNNLESLPAELFNDLGRLRELDLRGNNLESLPAEVFDGLFNLQTLALTGNSLTPPLPAGLFNDVLGSLIQLSLDDEVKSTVFIIEEETFTIAPGIPQTYTAQLIPASPADVRLNILVAGPTEDVMLPSTTVTIPAGMTTATFDIGLTAEADEGDTTKSVQLTNRALLYTDTNNDVQENTAVIGSLVNVASTANRTFTVGAPADASPTATLTRDRDSIEEDVSTFATFTLALTNAPDGPATVTYVLSVTGDNRTDDDISATLSGAATNAPVIGSIAMLTTTVINNSASISIRITPLYDEDAVNEFITLAISRVEFADITLNASNIVCSACSNDGELSITLVDVPNAEVRYDLTDPYAFEPAADGTNAGTGTFTITLSNLDANGSLNGSSQHRFTFRLEPDDAGATPGYGSIGAADPADTDDFNLFVEYMDSNDMPRELPSTITDDNNGYTFPPQDFRRAKRNDDGEQTYIFHVVPTRNDDSNRLMERVVFGLHVFFNGANSQFTTAVVNNSGTAPAVTISEAPVVTLTRAPSTVTEGTTGQFILDLGTVPGDVATVTYTLVVTGPNASANDITVIPSTGDSLVVNGTGDMATVNLNIDTPSRLTIAVRSNEDNDPDDELVTLTISQIEIADIILGPDDLMCDDCDPAAAGALSITVLDNDTPTVTLTRNQASVTEGAGTAATFTLALRHVPNGRSTVTFTVKITGSETISPNFFGTGTDGRAPGGSSAFRFVSSNADTTLILMRSDGVVPINIDNNTANFNVHITPNNDGNSTNEIITYAVTRIRFSGGLTFGPGDIMCDDCDPDGSSSLSVTVIDADAEPSAPPTAAYDNPADIAITEGGGPAASAERVLTLTDAPNSVATVSFELAGGTAHVAGLNQADIDFSVRGGGSLVIANGGMGGTFMIPAGTPETTLTFTARDSTDSTGERITFTITGITFANGDTVAEANLPGALTITIDEGALQLRIRVFLEGALQ